MKKIISLALASMMLLSAAACGKIAPTELSATSSAVEFLAERLGTVPEGVILGDATVAESYGVDMSEFEDDGYILRTVGDETLVLGKTEDGLDRAVRSYAKAVQSGTADTLNETYHEGYRIERLTIAGRDISEYTIYYPETANENMKFAAKELMRLVKKATGVTLPVVVGDAVAPAIELRHTNDEALKDDGYRYSVTDDGLVIEGAVDRGCMNGVWRFLQHECGWDRLIFGDSYLNEADHVNIPVDTERSETPIFHYLGFYNGNERLSNERANPTPAQGSYPMTHPGGHGMFYGKYCDFDGNTEQICYTDEARYEECYGNVRDYVASMYDSPGFSKVDLGQGDNTNFCLCDDCLVVFREEGGTHAGAVVRFMNRLSEELNEEFPGISYAILAYGPTKQPPKVTKPNEHLIINFCYDFNCVNHPVDGSKCTTGIDPTGQNNKYYDELLRTWCEYSDKVYVRNYNIGQHLLDCTMIDIIYDEMRYYRDIGVKGLLYELQVGHFGTKRLEKQLIHEMNWNPDMTREEYEEEYRDLLEYEYGDGWVYIWEYINELALAQSLTGCFHCWGWNVQYYFYDDKINTHFYKDRFDDYLELFDAAIAAADTAKQQNNAELLSCNVIYMGCYSSYFLEYIEGDTERMNLFEERWTLMLERLVKNGYDPKRMATISNSDIIHLSDTAAEEAWTHWYNQYERLTGQPLPEDAPVITE